MSVRQKKLELIEAMNRARALEPSSFVPNKLLDTLIEKMHLKNDAELCRVLEVQPPIISKIRHRKLAVGATILLRMSILDTWPNSMKRLRTAFRAARVMPSPSLFFSMISPMARMVPEEP